MSKFFNYDFWHTLKVNKEGIVIGGVMGGALAYYLYAVKGVSFLFAAESPGIIDVVVSGSPITTVVLVKAVVFYVIVGSIAGYITDAMWKPNK